DGIVNSFLEGSSDIGGHLVFASPAGIVVGTSGILNVGSLLLTTPTQAFLDGLMTITGSGEEEELVIDGDYSDSLLIGSSAKADDGDVTIDGTINALGAVVLDGDNVSLSAIGAIHAGTDTARA